MEKRLENQFSFVHIDGQHDLGSVATAAYYFMGRMPIGGIIAFDNTDNYDHSRVDLLLKRAGFEFLETIEACSRSVYRKTEYPLPTNENPLA